MEEVASDKSSTFANKCAAGLECFAKSKSGNVILDFIMFRKNLLQFTLQIVFVGSVLAFWTVAVMGIFKQGPIGAFFTNEVIKDGKQVEQFSFFAAFGVSLAIIVFTPFVLHYILEIVVILWRFIVHVYEKIVCPIWNTVVIRFMANAFPQVLPFLYERFMKAADICVDKLGDFLNAIINGINTCFVTMVALLKGVMWLPMAICRRFGVWIDEPQAGQNK